MPLPGGAAEALLPRDVPLLLIDEEETRIRELAPLRRMGAAVLGPSPRTWGSERRSRLGAEERDGGRFAKNPEPNK